MVKSPPGILTLGFENCLLLYSRPLQPARFLCLMCLLRPLPHGPNTRALARGRGLAELSPPPHFPCLHLMELLQMRIFLIMLPPPLPGDTQPISSCNFVLLAKKKFQHLPHLFFISLFPPNPARLGPADFHNQTTGHLPFQENAVNFTWLLSETPNVWKNTFFLLFSSPAPHQYSSESCEGLRGQVFSAPVSPIRRVISLHLIPPPPPHFWSLLHAHARKFFFISNLTLSCFH